MIRRPPRSTQSRSSAASDVYKRQAPSYSTSFAPGILSAIILEFSGGIRMSSAPQATSVGSVSYTHLRAHETRHDLVCRLLLEKKKKKKKKKRKKKKKQKKKQKKTKKNKKKKKKKKKQTKKKKKKKKKKQKKQK